MESQSENELLRKYLNRIAMQLMFGVPRAERRTIGQELTQHLNAMIEDEIAEGASREEATAAALRRFGDPRKVGRNIRKKWLQKHPYQLPETALLSNVTQILALLSVFLLVTTLIDRFVQRVGRYQPYSVISAFMYGAFFQIFMEACWWFVDWSYPRTVQVLNAFGLSSILRYEDSNAALATKRKYMAKLLDASHAPSSGNRGKISLMAVCSRLVQYGILLAVGTGAVFLLASLLHPGRYKNTIPSDWWFFALMAGVFLTKWAIGRVKSRWAKRELE